MQESAAAADVDAGRPTLRESRGDQMSLLEKEVLTTGEVAKICNVAPRTVSKWVDTGVLSGYRIPGSRDRRVPKSNLLRFMKAHNIPLDRLPSGRTRVLLVDDDREIVDTLQNILSQHTEYEIRTATTGFQAGMECERFKPGVLLVDIHIGDGEGKQLVDAVRRNEQHAMTKIIAMSGKLTDGQAQALRAGGPGQQAFDEFLKKPFSVRQVVDTIQKVLTVIA